MSAKSKAILQLGDEAIRWLQSLASKLGYERGSQPLESLAEQTGDKLKNLSEQYPEAFRMYSPEALFEVLREAQKGDSDLAIMDPEIFRKLAATIDINNPITADMVRKTVDQYTDDIRFNVPLSNTIGNIPYLQYEMPTDRIAQVIAHDGRHRNRALEELNRESLVRITPTFDSKTPSLSKIGEPVDLYSEVSSMQKGDEGGKKIGSSKDLLKLLSAFGALPFITGEQTDE
jgi:hypothetical protein